MRFDLSAENRNHCRNVRGFVKRTGTQEPYKHARSIVYSKSRGPPMQIAPELLQRLKTDFLDLAVRPLSSMICFARLALFRKSP